MLGYDIAIFICLIASWVSIYLYNPLDSIVTSSSVEISSIEILTVITIKSLISLVIGIILIVGTINTLYLEKCKHIIITICVYGMCFCFILISDYMVYDKYCNEEKYATENLNRLDVALEEYANDHTENGISIYPQDISEIRVYLKQPCFSSATNSLNSSFSPALLNLDRIIYITEPTTEKYAKKYVLKYKLYNGKIISSKNSSTN